MLSRSIIFITIVLISPNIESKVTKRTLADGINYEHITTSNPHALSIHLLEVNPQKAKIIIEAANGICASSETTSSMALRKNAIAAINGGFFDFGQTSTFKDLFIKFLDIIGMPKYKAFPIYNLKIEDRWLSSSAIPAGTIAWNKQNQDCIIDVMSSTWFIKINDKIYPIAEVNKPNANGPILYNSAYGSTVPTNKQNIEIVIENNCIKEIKESKGNTSIPKKGYVYSIKKSEIDVSKFKIEDKIDIVRNIKSKSFKNWQTMDYILSSTPILIYNNKLSRQIFLNKKDFYANRHPRTAVGILNNKNWLFLVVDGRQKISAGLSLPQLALFMKKRGCTYALNLDGGGSSTFVIENQIVNSPSGREYSLWKGKKAERPISNAILILSK